MSAEPERKQQTVKTTSYSPKPFGWFLHIEYRNDEGQISYAQIGFGPNANGVDLFPLWKSPATPVVISCPLEGSDLFQDYHGDLLVPIPEMVIQTMFTGLPTAPKPGIGIRRA